VYYREATCSRMVFTYTHAVPIAYDLSYILIAISLLDGVHVHLSSGVDAPR
jgi:hypothetical protein